MFNLENKNSYHTHSYLCDHSNIEMEQLVIDAIAKGYDEIALTDHIWYDHEGSKDYRLKSHHGDEYLDFCCELKNKYADKISIVIGYESEYFPEFRQHYLDIKNDPRVDFLILSNHYFGGLNDEYKVWYMIDDDKYIHENFALLKEGWELGVFDMHAHPDIIYHNYPFNETARSVTTEMAKYIKENNIPVEINANGMRKYSPHKNEDGIWQGYPNFEMWKIFQEHEITNVISNGDTHFYDELDDIFEQKARQVAKLLKNGELTEELFEQLTKK